MRLSSAAFACAPIAVFLAPDAAWANSGVQLRLDQYQAGQEATDSSLITNPRFETVDGTGYPTGWQNNSAVMRAATPDPGNLPNPASTIGARSGQAFNAGGVDPFSDYKFFQTVTLTQNTDYVLSAYIWNYGFSGPPPVTDLFAGDLAVVEVVQPDNVFNSTGVSMEPTALDNQSGSRGYFLYKTFNSSQFPNGQVQLEVEFDPNQDLQFGVNRPALSAQYDNIALTPLAQFSAQKYTNTTTGTWTNAAEWINGPANAPDAVATFAVDHAAEATVNLPSSVTVAVMNLNATGGYRFTGGGTLVLDHEGPFDSVIFNNLKASNRIDTAIVVQAGSANLGGNVVVPRQVLLNVANPGDVLTLSQTMTAAAVPSVGAGSFDVQKNGPGRAETAPIRSRQLLVNQGTLRFIPGATQSSNVTTLTLAGGSTPTVRLELTNTALVVDYAAADPSPLATLRAQIVAAYNGGSFNLNGIAPGYQSGYGIGYGEASQLASVPPIFGTVDSTAVLLRGTLNGDATLDGTVNISDFSLLASNFNLAADWLHGDFNYDGSANIGDFSLLAANFNRTVSIDSPRGALAAVPEPAGLPAAVLLLKRRRR